VARKAVCIDPNLRKSKELFQNSLVSAFTAVLVFPSIAKSCYLGQFGYSLRTKYPELIQNMTFDEAMLNPAPIIVKYNSVKKVQLKIDSLFNANYRVLEDVYT